MKQLRQAYMSRLPGVARILREALCQSSVDREEVRLLCHRLRGSAGAYGLPDLTELAARAEEASAEALEDAVRRLVDHIDTLAATPT